MKLLLILGTLLSLAKGQVQKATLKSLVVTSDIKVRYAKTLVSAEYFNDKNSAATADFHVILPDRAYISNFSMEMNGEVSVGEVKEKAEAKKIYKDAVRRGESAGHVSVRHRFTKQFDMRVNIEPNVKVVFNLTYEELLKRTQGNYSHQIYLFSEIIDKMIVEVFISDPQEIRVLDEHIDEDLSVRSVDYVDNKHVYIRFDPSREEQQKLKDAGHNGEFTIEYDVDRNNSNVVYTLDGYFVHFFSPNDEPIWPKNIVFMVDVSGSMKGRKLRQVRAAMHSILASLDPHKDTFTFGTFSRNVSWQHSESMQEAEKFIASLKASGDTNINEAMLASLAKLEKEHPSNTADILFFLTDGEPTSGVTDKEDIRKNVKEANKRNVLIFTLGFGEDCDHTFLKNIAADNNGFSRKIYIDGESDKQIKDMFNEISNLLLKNVIITYVDDSIDVGKLTKNEFKTIFNGSEIAIAGPLKKGKDRPTSIVTEIRAENAESSFVRTQKLDLIDVDLDELDISLDDVPNNPNLTKLHELQDITKKTWAYLSLKKMFEEKAPKVDIIALAIEYGFVTHLTSMVVVKNQLRGEESGDETDDGEETGSLNGQAGQADPGMQGLPGMVDASRMDTDIVFDAQMRPGIPLPLPTRKEHPTISDRRLPTYQRGSISLPDLHTKWIKKFSPFAATSTSTATTSTSTIAVATTTPTSTVPYLPRVPAIVVKPAKCNVMLCVSQQGKCYNQTKLLLLKDRRADVEIYGEEQISSPVTCIDNLYKITIKSRRRNIEITPPWMKINRKRINTKNRSVIRFQFKKFFRLDVFFNRTDDKEVVSIKFLVQDHMKTSRGLYSQYLKRYDCKVHEDKVFLSHMKREFTKLTFASPVSSFNNCYM